MAHHKRKRTRPEKEDSCATYEPPSLEDGSSASSSSEGLTKRHPAKLPRGYCKKRKGEHNFQLVEERHIPWHRVNRNGTIETHSHIRKEYRCSGCNKKKVDSFFDGEPGYLNQMVTKKKKEIREI